MREPPRKLDVSEFPKNPDVMNVQLFLCGVKQSAVLSYDMDEGWLIRHRMKNGEPVLRDGEWLIEKITFAQGELEVRWFDKSKVNE